MEVAGLVLGGLPIVLYAIDNYHRCLEATADYWRYESTLKLIRNHVFVQQQQLQITLRSIGLVNPTAFELEEYLCQNFPNKFHIFVDIISHMEKLLTKLFDKLDVDAHGRPKWTSETPDRVVWEWRRVRRGFGRSSRDKLITELQFWNDRLKDCFEKTELLLEDDTPTSALETVRSKFNSADCNIIRQRASRIHEAISTAWPCQSHEQHAGNLMLPWHAGPGMGAQERGDISFVFPPLDGTGSSRSWLEISCDVPGLQLPTRFEPDPTPSSKPSRSRASSPNPRPWKRLKGLFQSSSNPQLAIQMSAVRSPSPEETSPTIAVDPHLLHRPIEVHCLCSFLHGANRSGQLIYKHTNDGRYLPVTMQRRQRSGVLNAIPLSTVFSQTSATMPLSRKDRFAVAAAATWAMLYLTGSPWIGPEWSGKQTLQLLAELQALQFHPAISCNFKRQQATESQQNDSSASQEQLADMISAGLVRNKTLFALGVLLIELSLNKPFEQLRQEYHASSLASAVGLAGQNSVSDFELANVCMQRVYLEAGDLYGYAVQRCLRCEFPGRDVTKSFEFEQFRTDFFHGVVAPVQVTFNLLQATSLDQVSRRV
ncbi:hypothetical protein QBC38DRAFT_99834 [Podospora fimiseda]|uniref:DUF7580 domain-containing protein n=1 Tax=Podospora fimiseda TaxID=252190 RepID=A0AAN7BFH0_9PEZI|nr:hypothetical protein QBC38DRAFT_99834 [Podospora fimiseda]